MEQNSCTEDRLQHVLERCLCDLEFNTPDKQLWNGRNQQQNMDRIKDKRNIVMKAAWIHIGEQKTCNLFITFPLGAQRCANSISTWVHLSFLLQSFWLQPAVAGLRDVMTSVTPFLQNMTQMFLHLFSLTLVVIVAQRVTWELFNALTCERWLRLLCWAFAMRQSM